MREKVWRDPDHMSIQTGHKTFDCQTTLITTGNIVADTQFGHYIRGELELTCWGDKVYKPGYLRNYDLGNFPGMPWRVRACVLEHTKGTEESVWVSKFFHYSGHRQIVHGYIVTTTDHKLLGKFVTGPTHKSGLVIDGVLPYIVEQEEEHGQATNG